MQYCIIKSCSTAGRSYDSTPTFNLDDTTSPDVPHSSSTGAFTRSVSQGAPHMTHSVYPAVTSSGGAVTRRQVSQPTPAPRSTAGAPAGRHHTPYGTPPPRYCDL